MRNRTPKFILATFVMLGALPWGAPLARADAAALADLPQAPFWLEDGATDPNAVTPTPTQPAQPLYFAGRWDCTGKIQNPHNGQERDTVGSLKVCATAPGLIVDRFENHTGTGKSFHAVGWTRTKSPTQMDRYALSNMGFWTHTVSKGWEGDNFTWTGKVHNLWPHRPELLLEETMHKLDDNSFEATTKVQYEGKQWLMYRGTCKRVHPFAL